MVLLNILLVLGKSFIHITKSRGTPVVKFKVSDFELRIVSFLVNNF